MKAEKFLSRRNSNENPFREYANDVLLRILLGKSKKLNRLRTVPIAVFGNDLIGAKVFLEGIYENESILDLFSLLSDLDLDAAKMTIADVGANIGNHSVQYSRAFGRVLSFEPNPRVYDLLEANTKRLGNVKAFPFGLGRGKSRRTIREKWDNLGESSAVHDIDADHEFEMDVFALDDLSRKLGKVDVMKIDVEGMEMDVLMGARKLISKDRPVICLEQHPSEFSGEFNETESLDWLRKRGYRMFALRDYKFRRWINRRLMSAYRFFFGGKRTIIEYPKLRRAKYHTIFAIHGNSISNGSGMGSPQP